MDRICVVGLGAIGGFVAHRLVESGAPVSALLRGESLVAVREHGLRLREAGEGGRGRAVPIRAAAAAAELGPQDLVILALKTTALSSVAPRIAPLIGPDTVVLSAMNGVPWWFFHGLDERRRGTRLESVDPDGEIGRAIPPRHVVGAVVHMAASCPEPGLVQHGFGDRFIVGEPGGAASARLDAIARLLRDARLGVETSSGIELDVWLKLWGNMTMNPVSALTGATLDRILDDPLVRRLVSDAMVEGAAIGAALGLPIGMTPEARHEVTRKLGAVKTSMLQDVEAGRPIELDALVGSVSELARLVGIDAPNVDALLGLTRLFARGRGLYPG